MNIPIKDTARILIGLECNYSCRYCCNKIPEVAAGFIPTRREYFPGIFGNYRKICISGGEPFCTRSSQVNALYLAASAKAHGLSVFMYTNLFDVGSIPDPIIDHIDGWNIGYHPSQITWMAFYKNLKRFLQLGPKGVRVQVQAGQEWQIEKMLLPDSVQIVSWKMNECTKNNEDIYILEGSEYVD
jgi:hypothetical protein